MNSSLLISLAILSCIINIATSLDAAQETVSKHGKLSVNGIRLTDSHGQPVQLKGMSLFWSVWMPYYWNRATVDSIHKACHSNIVRAAMAVENDGYLTHPDVEMERVETIIEAAIANDIYVIVDWHDSDSEKHLAESKDFFDKISKKYGRYPNIIYETYNEPISQSWSAVIKPYHQSIISTIRSNDQDNVIIVGVPHFDQEYDQAINDPITGQRNIMYTLHFYSNEGGNDQLRDRADKAMSAGLPIFVTEYGTSMGSGNGTVNAAATQVWYDWLDRNGLSYVNWALSDKDESASSQKAGTPPEQACQDNYLTESGRIVVAQNKK
ncbi:hypothetical protein NQ314_016896 [Rhamnusium bicolor]|uniref:Glycoside hydrolase family 5 domain-containing protein n=1 Tax=Rhamnusium bicolor TaxID=1586634 RepID=A0AAV8WV56_9CUCU|nr:hypothetical protein NQ314_016896 [Rhamnusium bicolor]UNG40333.1 glycoside hydrolase family 5 subfamily 2 [Rhamnusium bicolor]